MKKEEVLRLIHKYFEGESSLEEEQHLKRYFSEREETDPELLPYAALFHYLQVSKATPEMMPRVPLPGRSPATKLWMRWSAVAAALLLLLALGTWFDFLPEAEPTSPASSGIDWIQYEPASPEAAFEVTRDALMRVAQVVDQTQESTLHAAERIQEATDILNLK